jgi:hypothetical protein
MDEVRPNQKSISADALNDAIKGGRTATGTRVAGGTLKQLPGAGMVIDATKREPRFAPDDSMRRDVVIKKSPSTNAGWVSVQRVQEMDWPIQPCTDTGCRIQVFGDEFEARPYFGQKTDSYKEFEIGTDAIGLSTKFFECRWDGRLWRLDPPVSGGSNVDACLVHAPFNGSTWAGSPFVRVVRLKYNAPGGNYISAETSALGYSIIKCWPGTSDFSWQYFQSTQGAAPTYTPSPTAVYLTIKKLNGVDHLAPEVPIAAFAPNPALAAGDC